MKLYSALIYHQKTIAEKQSDFSRITIGPKGLADFCVNLDTFAQPFAIFENGKLRLRSDMIATLSFNGKCWHAGEKRTPENVENDIETYTISYEDWAIVNLAPGLDFVLCHKQIPIPIPLAHPLLNLTEALESPVVRAIVISFALHSALMFILGMTAEPIERVTIKQLESRWVEMLTHVEELQEEEKEDLPVIEDVDNVIIDDAMKDLDRPKIDDNPNPIANLDKVEKPVGIQAALGGAKLHDMESLFGSSAGLGDALDFMPETVEGDAFGTGAGFGAGLSGIGIAGGGGGGGGYGSGIGGIGGGGKGGGSGKVKGPKKSGLKQKPKLTMDAPKQGAFCKESNIRDVVQKRANALRNCYEQQLLANPELSGKIIVFWKIGLDGKVTDASIKSTTMNNNRVESCLTQTVRRLRFDKPDGGICVVEFPFIFTSAQ
jgi:uncharacterized membrane protein YgcG